MELQGYGKIICRTLGDMHMAVRLKECLIKDYGGQHVMLVEGLAGLWLAYCNAIGRTCRTKMLEGGRWWKDLQGYGWPIVTLLEGLVGLWWAGCNVVRRT